MRHTDGYRLSPVRLPEEVDRRGAEAHANSGSRVFKLVATRPRPDRHQAIRHAGPVTRRSKSPHAPSGRAHTPRTARQQDPRASTRRTIAEAFIRNETRRPDAPALVHSEEPTRAVTRESRLGAPPKRDSAPHPERDIAAASGWCSDWSGTTASGGGCANTSAPAVRSAAKADRQALRLQTSPLRTPKYAQPQHARTTEVVNTRQSIIAPLSRHDRPTVASAPANGSPVRMSGQETRRSTSAARDAPVRRRRQRRNRAHR